MPDTPPTPAIPDLKPILRDLLTNALAQLDAGNPATAAALVASAADVAGQIGRRLLRRGETADPAALREMHDRIAAEFGARIALPPPGQTSAGDEDVEALFYACRGLRVTVTQTERFLESERARASKWATRGAP
jgi:hypothetical protein